MGLTGFLPRVRRGPRVLLLSSPDATALRLEAEAAVRRMGGFLVMTPVEADLLLEAGVLSGSLRGAADTLWKQIPAPGRRVVVQRAGRVEVDVGAELDGFPAAEHVPGRRAEPRHVERGEGEEEMPAGLPMAGRERDRDGLTLDVLHLPLGPFLPYWPAGLVVDTVLQGDVVQQALARDLPVAHRAGAPFWSDADDPKGSSRRTAAAHLDSLGRLLALAGWASAARQSHVLRDTVLKSDQDADVRPDFDRLRRRIERSRMLRWQTDGLGVLPPAEAACLGVDGPATRAGAPWDATARWRQWLAEAADLLNGRHPTPGEGPRGPHEPHRRPSRALVEAAVALLPGLEIAQARLVMASFDPDPEDLVTAVGRRKA
jgi:hypothetical protein